MGNIVSRDSSSGIASRTGPQRRQYGKSYHRCSGVRFVSRRFYGVHHVAYSLNMAVSRRDLRIQFSCQNALLLISFLMISNKLT